MSRPGEQSAEGTKTGNKDSSGLQDPGSLVPFISGMVKILDDGATAGDGGGIRSALRTATGRGGRVRRAWVLVWAVARSSLSVPRVLSPETL